METETVYGLVAMSQGVSVTLKEIVLPDPGPGDAVARVLTCGVRHADLYYWDGGVNDDFSFLLGHETAEIVERTDNAMTDVSLGGFVVLSWRAVCGTCRACRRGEPQYCLVTFNASRPMIPTDDAELAPTFGIGAFAEKIPVHSGQCTKVDSKARPAAVRSPGYGVMAGLRTAINAGDVGRGESVAVIECGRVGCAVVAGATLTGTSQVIVVGRGERRFRWTHDLGATGVVDGGKQGPVMMIRTLTGGFGADVVIDAADLPETWEQAFYIRDLAGTAVSVGVLTLNEKVPRTPPLDVFSCGGSLKSGWYGDRLPSRGFPVLIDLYRRGRLDLDASVSEEIALGEVEWTFDWMKQGEVL